MKKRFYSILVFVIAIILGQCNIFAQSPGNALDFDGSNDYVTIPDAAALDITDQITLEGWVKPSSGSWVYKKTVTVDYTKVSSTLSNFPVLVSVTDTDLKDSDNGGVIQPDGDDILFKGTDGTTLPHEIEEYDGSTGLLRAWVKVPSLSSSADTEFYIYYGNSSCSSQQDASGVWSADYEGVWHLNDKEPGTIIFEDGFESAAEAWDDKWENNGTTLWAQKSDQFTEGSFSAGAKNNEEGYFTSNDIDASSADFLTIYFWIYKKGIDAGQFNLYFFDGTDYDLIGDLDTLGIDETWLRFNMVVTDTQYFKSDFRIRFEAVLGKGDNVWVDDLKVIADGPTVTDSSPNSVNSEKDGSTEIAGQIGNAQEFDGLADRVYTDDVIDNPTQVTLSAWVKHDNLSGVTERYVSLADKMVIRHDGNNYQSQLHFYIRMDGGTGYHIRVNDVLTADDTWYYVTGTFDGTKMRVFLNGVQLDSLTPGGTTLVDPAYNNISQDSETMDGIIDEARVSSNARDTSWIGTEYRNQLSPSTFLSLGTQVSVGANKYQAYGISTNNSSAYATINDQILSGSVNAGEWNHIALTYNKDAGGTDEIKLYINGAQSATADYSTAITSNSNDLILGDIAGLYGLLDEVRLWDTVRTVLEIRENMHRVVTSGSEPNLVAYWQFNESSGTSAADSAGSNTGTLTNMTDGDWVSSPAPFGGGLANTNTSFTSGTTDLGTFSLTTTDAFDNAVYLTSTEVLNAPNTLPSVDNQLDTRYWIVDVFGSPGTYETNLTFTIPAGFLEVGHESYTKLYNRSSNSDGSWTEIVSTAASITDTTVTFNAVSTLGQFTIGSSTPMPVELSSFTGAFEEDGVTLRWRTETEVNNYGFEIEKNTSDDPSNGDWETIDFITGYGNSNSPKEYSYTDNQISSSGTYHYRLRQIDFDGTFEYSPQIDVEVEVSHKFVLHQNYPNPFNPTTRISFELPSETKVKVTIYNILGEVVEVLTNDVYPQGSHELIFNGGRLAAGIYCYSLQAGNNRLMGKMLLLK
ncbi:DUF2341 domain-containing protein [Bacteroidota bacterium]